MSIHTPAAGADPCHMRVAHPAHTWDTEERTVLRRTCPGRATDTDTDTDQHAGDQAASPGRPPATGDEVLDEQALDRAWAELAGTTGVPARLTRADAARIIATYLAHLDDPRP